MNTKFILGSIFGLVVGVSLSFASPIFSKEVTKEITLNKSNVGTKKTEKAVVEKKEVSDNKELKEAVELLKDIKTILKDNAALVKDNNRQTQEMAKSLKELNDRMK
ncbi:MAG: hypothetical protein AABZ74_13520 [Cyanobacteriota bacterium]